VGSSGFNAAGQLEVWSLPLRTSLQAKTCSLVACPSVPGPLFLLVDGDGESQLLASLSKAIHQGLIQSDWQRLFGNFAPIEWKSVRRILEGNFGCLSSPGSQENPSYGAGWHLSSWTASPHCSSSIRCIFYLRIESFCSFPPLSNSSSSVYSWYATFVYMSLPSFLQNIHPLHLLNPFPPASPHLYVTWGRKKKRLVKK